MRAIAITLGTMLVLAGSTAAQTPEALHKGTMSLAFSLPESGSSSAGVWRFLSDRDALGIMVRFRVNRQEVTSSTRDIAVTSAGFGIGPSFKHYFTPRRRVAPCLQNSLAVNWDGVESDEINGVDHWGLDATGGFGVDWFPVEEISVGGFVGLRASYDSADLGDDDRNQSAWSVGTVTSALTAHVYF